MARRNDLPDKGSSKGSGSGHRWVLDFQDKDEVQPPKITDRLWAELEQQARESESKTPEPSRPVPQGHTGRSARQAGGPGRRAGGSSPSAKSSTSNNTPRGTQRMSFREQKSREMAEREKARRTQQRAKLCKECGFRVWYPMCRDKNTLRTNWQVHLDSTVYKTNIRRNSIWDTSCPICPGKIFQCPAD